MVDALAPLLFASSGILVWAGVAKLRRPDSAARALYAAGLPHGRGVVRVLAAWEVAVGATCLVRPGVIVASALAITYLAFAGFLILAIWVKPGIASCGCLGERDAAPSVLHLGLNVVAAGAGAAVAIAETRMHGVPLEGLQGYAGDLGPLAAPFFAGIAATAYLAYAAAALLPQAFAAYREPPHDHAKQPRGDRHRRADRILSGAGVRPGHPSLWGGDPPATMESPPSSRGTAAADGLGSG